MEADVLLERALLVALAIAEERDLALLWAAAREAPAVAPAEVAGLSDGVRERLRGFAGEREPERQRERARQLGFELVPWGDARWPEPFADLAGPPPVLWLRGRGPWPPVH